MHTWLLTLANGETLITRALTADGALVARNIDLFHAIRSRSDRARREALEQNTAVRAEHSDQCACVGAIVMTAAELYA